MENAKIEKFKCDILGDFQTLCIGQDRQNVAAALHMVCNATADLFDYFYPPGHPEHPRKSEISRMCRVMHNMHLVLSANRLEDVSDPLHAPLASLSAYQELAVFRDSFSGCTLGSFSLISSMTSSSTGLVTGSMMSSFTASKV